VSIGSFGPHGHLPAAANSFLARRPLNPGARERSAMAHHIAAWLGIPAGIVIAAMVILRKKGMALRARRQQARAASHSAPGSRSGGA
jgi:hypothetical protein